MEKHLVKELVVSKWYLGMIAGESVLVAKNRSDEIARGNPNSDERGIPIDSNKIM